MTLSISQLLRFAVEQGASDIHISAGERPVLRIRGEVARVDHPQLTAEEAHSLIFEIMDDGQRRTFQERLELDFAYSLGNELRFRVNAFVQNKGEGAVLRHIPHAIPELDKLRMPAAVSDFCTHHKGIVLVTGPTGSGKSTTLAAMIDSINRAHPVHILTLEDPIEFVHTPQRAIINQREIGAQSHSFANALKSALREDPDIILVGELRDLETISLALTAAETGHLVFATLHTSSAPKTVDRIIDAFPSNEQAQIRTMLSESLVGVITQSLFKRCGGGRVAAVEVLCGTSAVRNLIREGKTFQIPSVMQVSGASGMQTMESAVTELFREGLITREDALARVPECRNLAQSSPGPALGAVG